MENFGGIFILILVGVLAYKIDENYKLKKQVKTMSVMNCSKPQLLNIIETYLPKFDDYQQIAFDKGKQDVSNYFYNAYDDLVKLQQKVQNGIVNQKIRNAIRLTLKEGEKYASATLQ